MLLEGLASDHRMVIADIHRFRPVDIFRPKQKPPDSLAVLAHADSLVLATRRKSISTEGSAVSVKPMRPELKSGWPRALPWTPPVEPRAEGKAATTAILDGRWKSHGQHWVHSFKESFFF
jgi:hypothetical protein